MKILVAGFKSDPDAYPNSYYRVRQIAELPGVSTHDMRVPLEARLTSQWRNNAVARWKSRLQFFCRHLQAWWRLRTAESSDTVYLPYPGMLLAWMASFRRNPPRLVVDAFISWYDTIVHDRQLVRRRSMVARCLYRFERRTYCYATGIVVDTESNRRMLTRLFNVPAHKVLSLPLAVTDESPQERVSPSPRSIVEVLFVGTFVPLHGIEFIIEAARILKPHSYIRWRLVGDGQSAWLAHDLPDNVEWQRNWLDSKGIADAIDAADICLGIFGLNRKTQRVWPLKNYLYLSRGKALITGDTVEARRLGGGANAAYETVSCGDPSALAEKVLALATDTARRNDLGTRARSFYEEYLSRSASDARLADFLFAVSRNNR